MNGAPRILVVSDVGTDAALVRELLQAEFDHVRTSIAPEQAVADFEQHRPEVLVLAFNKLEKAERYYLGLYRLSALAHVLPHRTLILCRRDDLQQAYALCKKEYFDDYILFWPMVQDTQRLPMAVHQALRQLAATALPNPSEIATQARGLADLEARLNRYAAHGDQQMAAASSSLQQAELDIGAALDRFYDRLSDGVHPGLGDIQDRDALLREIKRLKADEIKHRFRVVNDAVQPVRQWVGALKKELEPQLESARALQSLAERVRPLVLVVEDDEFQHPLLRQVFANMNLDLVFVTSGTEALASLHKQRPDLVLMDVGLPDIDGVETTRRIKSIEQFAHIPVVMITGHSERAVVVESLKAGAADFAVKPYDKAVLREKVRNFLHIAQA